MTISSSLPDREQYSGNDVTTAFTVNFEFDDESELDVYLDGTLQTITTHYTVSGGSGSSGTVTMVTAPATGETLTIVRDMGFDQAVDSNDTAETTYDKLTSQIRQLEEEVNRCVKLPPTSTITDAAIAYGEITADYYFKINSAADGVEAVDLTSTFQATDSDLTALAALSSNGIAARTGSGTWSVRTITAGSGTSITNGDGVSGNPTIAADINGLTTDGSPDLSNDFVMTYDASAGGLKKVALTNLTGGSASPTFVTTEDETTDYPNSLKLTKGDGINIEDTSNTVTVSWDPNNLASITSLQGTDSFGFYDSSNTAVKKITWTNLSSEITTLTQNNLDINGLTSTTPTTGDEFVIYDATAGGLRKIDWSDIPAVAASTLSGLSDTSISGVASGNLLYYNGSAWANVGSNGAAISSITTTWGGGSYISQFSAGTGTWDSGLVLTAGATTSGEPSISVNGAASDIGISIDGKGAGNVSLGTMTFDTDQTIGAGQDNYVLTYDNGTGLISLEAGAGSDTFTSIEVDGVAQSTNAPTLDFDGTDFTLTESPTDDFDITINVERIQDIAGAMFTGNTETGVTVTYQDGDGTIDVVVDDLTVAGDSGSTGMTPGDTLTVAGGTAVSTSMSGDTLTINSSAIENVVDDTTPQLGGQLDVNGNAIGDGTRELLTFTEDASAVNHINIENEATGSGPILSSAGDDVDIDLNITPKGAGDLILNTDTVQVEQDIAHIGDTDNKIAFGTDTQDYQTGGSSRLDISDSGVRLGGANARVTTILDEDNMASDSATALATQQSIKKYVDDNAGGGFTILTPTAGSGSSIDFTIPSGVKVIHVMVDSGSLDGNGVCALQLGDSGGIETTGYEGQVSNDNTGGSTQYSSQWELLFTTGQGASSTFCIAATLILVDSTNHIWAIHGNSAWTHTTYSHGFAGQKSLSAELTTVRFKTSSGNFDAGTFNVAYL